MPTLSPKSCAPSCAGRSRRCRRMFRSRRAGISGMGDWAVEPAASRGAERRRLDMPSRWSLPSVRVLMPRRTGEAVTIALAAALSVGITLVLLPDARGAAGAGLALLMIAIAAADARWFIIPDELSAAALLLGFVHAAWLSGDTMAVGLAVEAL